MKEAYLNYEDAQERVNELVAYFGEGTYAEESAVDCDYVPCPNELGTWSGTTSGWFIYNADDEEVACVAYWQVEPMDEEE